MSLWSWAIWADIIKRNAYDNNQTKKRKKEGKNIKKREELSVVLWHTRQWRPRVHGLLINILQGKNQDPSSSSSSYQWEYKKERGRERKTTGASNPNLLHNSAIKTAPHGTHTLKHIKVSYRVGGFFFFFSFPSSSSSSSSSCRRFLFYIHSSWRHRAARRATTSSSSSCAAAPY